MPSLLLFPQPPQLTAGPLHQVPRPSKTARKNFNFFVDPYMQASRSCLAAWVGLKILIANFNGR